MNGIDELYNNLEDYQTLRYRMDNEGMEYCFKHYSSFEEIKDDIFHKLRQQYIEISNQLIKYVDNKISEIQTEIDEFDSNN